MSQGKKYIIAPDSFKGTLGAPEVARAIARAIAHGTRRFDPETEIVLFPIADGGEGTLDIMAPPPARFFVDITPADGVKISAEYGYSGNTAVIESARAVGLPLMQNLGLDAGSASTYPVGELITDALRRGFRSFMITVGGSGTNDGGSGMLEALGAVFSDKSGMPLGGMCGNRLSELGHIDLSGLNPLLSDASFTFACDVTNPLTGTRGATFTYAPQKAADPDAVRYLEEGMKNYASLLCLASGKDVGDTPGCGAGGGLPAPLVAIYNAEILSGIDAVLRASDFRAALSGASLVLTGEGCIDGQSAYGKAVSGVARAAAEFNIPVWAICGTRGDGYEALLSRGISRIFALTDIASKDEAMSQTEELLERLTVSALETENENQ